MNLLRINCSPRPQSLSNKLADSIQKMLTMQHENVAVTTLQACQLQHVDSDYAERLISRQSLPAHSPSLDLSDQLIQQLRDADALLIATPMHNFTVPSSLKSWIDHVVRIGETFQPTPQGKVGTLTDRPVYIAIAAGGLFQGEDAGQPDFLTHYLRVIFNTIGITSLHYFVVEGTVMGDTHLQPQFNSAEQKLAQVLAAHMLL